LLSFSFSFFADAAWLVRFRWLAGWLVWLVWLHECAEKGHVFGGEPLHRTPAPRVGGSPETVAAAAAAADTAADTKWRTA